MTNNRNTRTAKGKKKDGKFHSKNVKHDPQGESARAVFGLKPPIEKEEK